MQIKNYDLQNVEHIQERFHLSSLAAKVLAAKKLSDVEIEALLNPSIDVLKEDLSFLQPAVERIYKAKQQGEKVMVCGDYDCDGICATSIVYSLLQTLGIESGYYIPNRFKEGYGLQTSTVQAAFDKGYSLLITVDNGVSSTQALQHAKTLGMDIILSDHHNYDESQLVYDYFLHPAIFPERFEGLCGSGVALLLSLACNGFNALHVVLAGVATIGDIVPLHKYNRLVVKACVALLAKKEAISIQALANDTSPWDEQKIAYQIVPKINSAGRLADQANVNTIVKYLLSTQPTIIEDGAKQICALNDTRKQLSAQMFEKAVSLVDSQETFNVLCDPSFHEGINGIVASSIQALTQKPTMVLSLNEGLWKGSIRSDSVDLRTYFDDCTFFVSYGGHKQAAGVSFKEVDLENVKQYIQNHQFTQVEAQLDCLLVNESELTIQEVASLNALKPFGCGFEEMKFQVETKLLKSTALSGGKHMKYESGPIEYLHFQAQKAIEVPNIVNLIGSVRVERFFRKTSVKMFVEHINVKGE